MGKGDGGQEERRQQIESERERERVDAVMRLVAVATSGERLCWALIYIVPHERKRESEREMEEKRDEEGGRERELVGRVKDGEKKKLTARTERGKE